MEKNGFRIRRSDDTWIESRRLDGSFHHRRLSVNWRFYGCPEFISVRWLSLAREFKPGCSVVELSTAFGHSIAMGSTRRENLTGVKSRNIGMVLHLVLY